jgi:hypothetical protein
MYQMKSVEEIRTNFMICHFLKKKLCCLWHNVEKQCRAGQATDAIWHIHIACWLTMVTHTHTLTICNTCFSAATMVARMCLSITFIHTLPVLFVIHFTLSRFVAQVLSVWLEMVPFVPIVTGISFAFTFHLRLISVVRSSLLYNVLSFLNHISVSRNCSIYLYTCSFFAVMDYDAQLIVRNGAVNLHLLIQHIVTLSSPILF